MDRMYIVVENSDMSLRVCACCSDCSFETVRLHSVEAEVRKWWLAHVSSGEKSKEDTTKNHEGIRECRDP